MAAAATESDEEDRVAWPPPGYRTGDNVLDAPVQATHLDAAGAKKVCADIGYFKDSYLKDIVPAYMCQRKSPMIHRGYWARTMAIRRAAEHFVKNADPMFPLQIVNLGSGLDTLYFHVRDMISEWSSGTRVMTKDKSDLTFFEVDFPVVISKKSRTIKMKNLLPESELVSSTLHSVQQIATNNYKLLACDMRQKSEFTECLYEAGFNGMANTLFLSECVLVYIQPTFADEIIQTSKEICLNPSALTMFVTYEQCNPDTAFGKQMVRNLRTRGCTLMGLDRYKTIPDQEERYKSKGYAKAKGWTMNQFTDKIMTPDEMKRLAKLEILDELEEIRLIQDHYFVLVACNEKYEPADLY